MPATDRLRSERHFHDRQARSRAETFRRCRDALRFTDSDYLDHETWLRPAFARFGDVAGQRVLDYGCGHGMAAVVLARRGAAVTACDLSPGYLAEVRARARANGVVVNCIAADGECLPFPDRSFDAVWGHAILHHLDVPTAARELRRVLRPGGVAVMCEPWGGNPLLRVARRWLPYPGKERTPDEEPLRPVQLRQLRAAFGRVEVEGHQLLAMVRRVLPGPRLTAALRRGDERLLRVAPSLWRFCRYVVVTLRP